MPVRSSLSTRSGGVWFIPTNPRTCVAHSGMFSKPTNTLAVFRQTRDDALDHARRERIRNSECANGIIERRPVLGADRRGKHDDQQAQKDARHTPSRSPPSDRGSRTLL